MQKKTITFSLIEDPYDIHDPVTVEAIISTPADPDSSKAIVLFLPFWGGSAALFKQVISRLEASPPQYTYLSISYSGTGNTPVPAHDTAEVHSIIPRAIQLKQFLQQSEIKQLTRARDLIICAHSMSAKIAYHLLTMLDPKHIRPTNLILLGPAPIGPLVLPPNMRQQQLQAYQNEESATWTINNVLTAGDGTLAPDVVTDLAKDCVIMSPGAKSGWLEHGMAVDCSEVVREVRERWPELVVKVLVGEKDKVETIERVKEGTLIPLQQRGFDVAMGVVEGVGHLLPVEALEAVQEAIVSVLCEANVPLG